MECNVTLPSCCRWLAKRPQINELRAMKLIQTLCVTLLLTAAARTASADTATNAITKITPKPDKLTTCPVSGDKLGEMAPPYIFIYQGQEVKLCCASCKDDFDKNPAKYLKKIKDAAKTSPAVTK